MWDIFTIFQCWVVIVSSHANADWYSAEDFHGPLQISRALSLFSFLQDSPENFSDLGFPGLPYLLNSEAPRPPVVLPPCAIHSLYPGRMLEHSWSSCFIFPFSRRGSLCIAAWLSNVPKNFVSNSFSVPLIASCGRINLVPDSPSDWNLKSLAFFILILKNYLFC